MKFIFALMACTLLTQSVSYAETISAKDLENHDIVENTLDETSTVTIPEVKELLNSLPSESTCLDDYMKRRKQLITKLALVPVTATASVMGSVYAGAAVGAGAAAIVNARDWSALGYIILGAGGGVAVSSAYIIYDTTKSTLDMIDNNLMIKVLAEQYLNEPGVKTDQMYQRYLKSNPDAALTKDELMAAIIEMDQSGALCDSSLVKQPKYKIGFKLKYKVAKSKDIFRNL